MTTLFSELKRRNAFRVGAAYLVVGWLLIEVVDTVAPRLGLPDWVPTFFIVAVLVGLPIALILSWAFELTPEGMKKTEEVDEGRPRGGQKLNYIIAGALVLALGFIAWDKLGSGPDPAPTELAEIEKSVAVLPFADLSPDGDQAWFSDGLTEEILNSLARLPELKVISRTSSFYFRDRDVPLGEIAARLQVAHIVEGSVRRAGDRLRVTAQLIRAADDRHIWSETYDASTDDVFSVQEDIAGKIATALDVFLDDAKREAMFATGTRNVAAYEYYLRGHRYWNEYYDIWTGDAPWRAIAEFEKAIAEDPNFARAHIQSADLLLHYLLGDTQDPLSAAGTVSELDEEAVYERMIRSYEAAVTHAPDPGTRLEYQIHRAFVSRDWRDLPALLDRLDVEHMNRQAEFVGWIPHILTAFGRAEQGLRLLDALLERNALGRISFALAAKLAYPAKGAEAALDYVARGQTIGAGPVGDLFWEEATIWIRSGRADELLTRIDKPPWTDRAYRRVIKAMALAALGRREEALPIIDAILNAPEAQEVGAAPYMAWALQALGEDERAEQIWRASDARLMGHVELARFTADLGGRIPFDLAWTPNFARRLAEAGVEPGRLEIPRPAER